jgi:hypothetical protein
MYKGVEICCWKSGHQFPLARKMNDKVTKMSEVFFVVFAFNSFTLRGSADLTNGIDLSCCCTMYLLNNYLIFSYSTPV